MRLGNMKFYWSLVLDNLVYKFTTWVKSTAVTTYGIKNEDNSKYKWQNSFIIIVFFILGHTWYYSEYNSCSALKDYSWMESNSDRACTRQIPYSVQCLCTKNGMLID